MGSNPAGGPAHHPDEAMLVAAAAGALDPALVLAVETHAALCPSCAGFTSALDAVAGAILESLAPAPLEADALERTLATLAADGPVPPAERPAGRPLPPELSQLPEPLRGLAGAAYGRAGWRRMVPGIAAIDLGPRAADRSALGEVRLYRMAPGAAVPRHRHEGCEVTLVLAGGYHDGIAAYGPGDFAQAGPDIVHRPRADRGEPCLALAISEAPIRPTGLIGSVLRALRG